MHCRRARAATWTSFEKHRSKCGGPVIYATLVVIAVFLPELFTSSVQGHFVGPLALAFILAVTASLLVAMTATPAMCALLLRDSDSHTEYRWLTWLQSAPSPGSPVDRETSQARWFLWCSRAARAPSRPCRFWAEPSCLNFAKVTS